MSTNDDPLAPSLLPAAAWTEPLTDAEPADSQARPFGLTLLTAVLKEQMDRVPSVSYDPIRQVSVTPDGVPLTVRTRSGWKTACRRRDGACAEAVIGPPRRAGAPGPTCTGTPEPPP